METYNYTANTTAKSAPPLCACLRKAATKSAENAGIFVINGILYHRVKRIRPESGSYRSSRRQNHAYLCTRIRTCYRHGCLQQHWTSEPYFLGLFYKHIHYLLSTSSINVLHKRFRSRFHRLVQTDGELIFSQPFGTAS